MNGRLISLSTTKDRTQHLTIAIDSDYREEFDRLKDDLITIEIKKASKARSMDANAYFWHLCSEIAKASSKYSNDGKNQVYREASQAKGEFTELIVKEEALDTFLKRWSKNGTGWFAEVVDDYHGPVEDLIDPADAMELMGDSGPRKIVHAYYGSSTYDSATMSRLIDYVVNIANDLELPTMTKKEQEKIIALWGKRMVKDNG